MNITETKRCIGCEEVKHVTEFWKTHHGNPNGRCKVCVRELRRIRRADMKRLRIVSKENRNFFRLGVMKADDYIRDLEKVINVQEKTIRGLVAVIKVADQRDYPQKAGVFESISFSKRVKIGNL